MSDSESSDSTDGDVAEQSSFGQPYQFEPVADSDYEDEETDEDGILREHLEARFNQTVAVSEWCTCGHCSRALLEDAREYRCCKEILECTGKFTFEGQDAQCILQHWDYSIVTHRTVLETAGAFLSDKSGKKYRRPTSQNAQNEYLRAVAYRWIVRWIFGMLGWENSRPLPACIYNDIRKSFSSQSTTGYKSAEQRIN